MKTIKERTEILPKDPVKGEVVFILENLTSDLRESVEELKEKYENDPLAVAAGMQDIKVNVIYDILELLDTLEGKE